MKKKFAALFLLSLFSFTMIFSLLGGPTLLSSLSGVKSEKQDSTVSVVSSIPVRSTVDLPILMYHGLTNKDKDVNPYFIPVTTFKSDLDYLRKNNYHTVTLRQVYRFVNEPKVTLPKNPIVITFDDGYCNNYNFAHPLLKKYKMKAVISLIGSGCDEASAAEYRSQARCSLTWEQVKEMSQSGLWEVGSHTYNLHENKGGRKGASMLYGEDPNQYRQMLSEDLNRLKKKIHDTTGTSPITFAWPFGAISEEGSSVLESMGIRVTLSCYSGRNTIKKGDLYSLLNLKRFLRTPKASLPDILNEP